VAIKETICASYLKALLDAESRDVYMIALYTRAATLGPETTVYSPVDEVVGTGYLAGGQALGGLVVGQSDAAAWIDWSTAASWPASSITARGALIYNSSKGNQAVAVLDFGVDKRSINGTFTIDLPEADGKHALVLLRAS